MNKKYFTPSTLGSMAIDLGKAGEGGHLALIFDVAPWRAAHPDAQIMLHVTPPRGAAYLAALEDGDGGCVMWNITDADTAYPGIGRIELVLFDPATDTTIKSVTGRYAVEASPSQTEPEDPPEPHRPWWEKVLQLIAAGTGTGGGSGAVIDDKTPSAATTYSSSKIDGLLKVQKASIPVIADKDANNVVSFRNSAGVVLFTLDLSDLGAGTAATYGNIVMSKESLTIGEGESGTFTVKLDAAPSGNQVVYVASSDETKLTFSPAFLTFTAANWETEQTVTVTAAQDEDDADETITVTLTSTKVDAKQLAVMITDDDKQVATVVTDGLTLQFNLRNGADLTDTVGGVVATNGGTTSDSGVVLDAAANKFSFVYPLQTADIPNGFTIEMALTGLADLQAAGSGYGNGYAYKGNIYSVYANQGFAYTANGTKATADNSLRNADDIAFSSVCDLTTENHVCMVYNADGSAKIYVNGTLWASRAIPDGFENYNVSGNLTFKLPYLSQGTTQYPITLSEFRIYERALTADEVVNNYNATVAHQSSVSF